MNAFRTLHRSILLLFAVVVIAIVTLVHFSISKIVAEQSRAQQSSTSPAVSLIVNQLLKPLHISEALGKSREIIDVMNADTPDEARIFSILSRLEQEFGMTFFIASEDARMQYNSDGTKIRLVEGEVNWYFKYKNIDDDEVADIGKWEDPHFYIDLKMYNDNGRFLGFFGIGKSLNSFINVFEQYKHQYGYDFLFVDPQGHIMLSSDPGLLASFSEFKRLDQLPWFSSLQEDAQATLDLNNRLVSIDEQDHLIGEYMLTQFDWTVYLLSPLSQRQAEISVGFIISIVTLLVVVFALFILIYNLLYFFKKGIKNDLVVRDTPHLPDKVKLIPLYERMIAEHGSVSLVIIDIDGFSQINDRYGRNAGDEVIDTVSQFLQQNLTQNHVLGRWSSEEFIILMPGTGPHEADKLTKNLRHGVATLPESKNYPGLIISCCFGVSYTATERPLQEVTANAEDALYRARRQGSNQVCVQLAS